MEHFLNKEVRREQLIELTRSGFASGSPRKRDTSLKSVPDYGTAPMLLCCLFVSGLEECKDLKIVEKAESKIGSYYFLPHRQVVTNDSRDDRLENAGKV
ncbi:hypothetical protein TNCV_3565291 [Trichonephila clavipes]|nr:hypothetical protein TNCV_3565291 [Trichonephila clavipes]